MTTTRKDNDFLNGVPELLLLRLLTRQAMHGYELVQTIRIASGEALAFGEGSIYPVLHRLEAEGSLASKREAVGGRSRVVYRITPAGRKRLEAATGQWSRIAHAVTRILEGGGDGTPALA